MISLKLLNSQAALNNYTILGAIPYTPGETLKLNVQLFNQQLNIRYIPSNTATLTFNFIDSEGVEINKVGTPLTDDRSIWSIELSSVETEQIIGGFVKATLVDGAETFIAINKNVLERVLIDGEC